MVYFFYLFFFNLCHVLEIQCVFYAYRTSEARISHISSAQEAGVATMDSAALAVLLSPQSSAVNTIVGMKGRFPDWGPSLGNILSSIKTHLFSRLSIFRNPESVTFPSFKQSLYLLLIPDSSTKEELKLFFKRSLYDYFCKDSVSWLKCRGKWIT